MSTRSIRIIHESGYAAEIPIDLIDEEGGWAPYLSFADATKLADVRAALRTGDIAVASKMARIYQLTPVEA